MLAIIIALLASTVDGANVSAARRHTWTRPSCRVHVSRQDYDCQGRMRWALLAISNRESPGSWSPDRIWVGVHRGDAEHSPKLARRGRASGVLSWWCPSHWGSYGFSTVGPHGLMYAYNVHRLSAPGNCVPWWVFAAPHLSAQSAALRYLELCGSSSDGWCPSLESTTETMRRHGARR